MLLCSSRKKRKEIKTRIMWPFSEMMKLEEDHFYLMIIFFRSCFCLNSLFYLLFFASSQFWCAFVWFIAPVPGRCFPVLFLLGRGFYGFCSRLRLGSSWQWRKDQHTLTKKSDDKARITSDAGLWNMLLARKWMNLLNRFFTSPLKWKKNKKKLSFSVQWSHNKICISFANSRLQSITHFQC